MFSYHGCVVAVDPFAVLVCDSVGVQRGEGVGVGEECAEVLGGGAVDLGGPHWGHFCCDFLLMDGSAMKSQTDLVVLVDGVLNSVMYALTGCGE